MKISYKVLKNYIKDLKVPEEVAKDLVMHTAEVEEIIYEGKNLEDVFIGKILTCEKHPDSDKLNCTTVKVNGNILEIVCGAPNAKAGLIVAVAVVGAKLTPDFEIKKTKIRGATSEGMLCSEDELGLTDERQAGILELPSDTPLGMSMREYLNKNDAILEIDNKAINHRPDLFSHIGIIREIQTINGNAFDFEYEEKDFSNLPDLGITNKIPDVVGRYIGLKVHGVKNIKSPDYIKQILDANEITSKGLLIDISNYSLYLYGRPTHCFDANKITGTIHIRYAENGETFTALNDKEYKLCEEDIVIADDNGVIALGGIIGGKESAVSDNTTSIIIEAANFDQAILRKTGKRLGVRTDSLNVFEKDLVPELAKKGVSLLVSELEKNLSNIELIGYSDLYSIKQKQVTVDFDLNFINNLIGKTYKEKETLNILNNLGIQISGTTLSIPFWRKDLTTKADIAEEIARIDGYGNVVPTIPRINLGAIVQNNIYTLKNDTRNFFTSKGFFDIYNYSFVDESLMKKTGDSTYHLIPLKNALSEELSHMKGSHIPGLLETLEKNSRDFDDLKLIEVEKVFSQNTDKAIQEHNSIAGLITSNNDIVYYDIQNIVSDYLTTLNVKGFYFDIPELVPSFAHKGRTANIIVRNNIVGIIGEIHPKIAKNFSIKSKIGFFEINAELLSDSLYGKIKAKDISEFQENNFDLSFVVEKNIKGKEIKTTIEKTNSELIQKVELFDIYENEEKLPGKRSLSFKIFISSLSKTLDDRVKNELINDIIKKVEKKGGTLR